MDFLNWFNFFPTKNTQLFHPFGRGINASLSKHEENLFNKSSIAFEEKKVLDAYEYFFKSLENFTNETSNKNILLQRDSNILNFTIFQGSAKITGTVTKENLHVEALVCTLASANVALKRYILDRNYQLTYAYYFIDDESIKIKLCHDNTTMTPQKIFFSLREITLNTDFDKEYIQSEFDNVVLQNISHLQTVNINEVQIKYKFLHSSIKDSLTKIEKLPSNDNSGMQSFILLNTFYMIDYLIVPHRSIYQKISKKLQDYFNEPGISIETKNNELKSYLIKLQAMNFEAFSKKFYNAKYTFNPTDKTPKEDLDNFINESLLKIRWYKNNRYPHIIVTIYKYISFYILYNYGLNPVMQSLLHMLVEIRHQEYFHELGYEELYNDNEETFLKKEIIKNIQNIIEPYQIQYKLLEPFGDELNYSSLNEFSNSFYLQIQNLNFEEV